LSTILTDSVKTLGSNPILTKEINPQPRDSKSVEISINRQRNTAILPSDNCHDHHPENIIPKMKNILAASLGVDQPRWSSLGANRYAIRLIVTK
tara:strand:- start:144 stop:425 length:282 start_codon:yes stop_codon:yes gene_type:complete